MPPRNRELPEGTDHIINGAMETGAGTHASTGTSGSGAGAGFIGSGAGDDTGGTAAGKGGTAVSQLKDGAASLKDQATGKARDYAVDGKNRAAGALDDFSKAVQDSAQAIDERLGAEYGEYARRAADAVSGFADTLRTKDVDELFEDARAIVRKSPVVAIGTAAAVGFALVRLVKSGIPDSQSTGAPRSTTDIDTGTGA